MTVMHQLKRIVVIIGVGLFAGLLFLFAGPPLRDWYVLRQYDPPAYVSDLATRTTMTEQGRRLFYLNRPEVLDASEFNTRCDGAGGEQTIVLGCYYSPQRGIFLFRVDEPELKGIEEVTAAHEMLHAAYDRLSISERRRIDSLLIDYYQTELKDERLLRVMELYKESAPDDLPNEMHSIFGTEISSLPEELEQHYRRYFDNRQVVASFAADYQSAFTSRQKQVDQYDAELSRIEKQIAQNTVELDRQAVALTSERRAVEASGDQEAVDAYNQRVAAYNSLLSQTNVLVDQFNQIVERRNGIALEQKQLQRSIDSSIQ
jgi:hypothetical protein